jgi:RND family efflux transporter MFP subunit
MSESERPGYHEPAPPPHATPRRVRPITIVLFLCIVAAVVIAGIIPRLHTRAEVRDETSRMAIPNVAVVVPQRSAPSDELILPAKIQAYTDAPIYARTNGYVKKWYADIGAHVKTGELLAEIDTPEIDQQLQQALADLGTAQANVNLAKITADRYQDLLKSDSVSKQDADNAAGDYEAKKADVASAQANVKRLQDLQSFQKIYAPFDGVITARNVDIGDLIDAGASGGAAKELFHIAATRRLRVYVSVPQGDSPNAKPGLKADVVLPEFPGRRFPGTLVSTAQSIDPASGTLLAEISVDNPTGELLPGAYAEVHLKLPSASPGFTLPVSALLFRSEGLRVVTVDSSSRALLVPIVIGRDYGNEVEVVSGLTDGMRIVENPPDSIATGEQVRITQTDLPQATAP